MQECKREAEGGGVRPGSPGTPRRSRGVSLQPQSRRGGSDIAQGETGDDDTPFTLTYDRCRAAPARRTTSMAGGTGMKEARSAARPRPPRCAPRPSPAPPPRALVLWLQFEVEVSDELESAVLLLLSSGVASKTPSILPPPARLFLFRLFLLLFLPVLSECSALPAFPPLFLPLAEWQTRAERRGRPVQGEGPRKEGKLDSTANRHFFIHFWRFLLHFL